MTDWNIVTYRFSCCTLLTATWSPMTAPQKSELESVRRPNLFASILRMTTQTTAQPAEQIISNSVELLQHQPLMEAWPIRRYARKLMINLQHAPVGEE